ncbi:NAD(+) kinase [Candidatus Steffania adelgidicola]|uniref:NAD(+) kinase n=1 Tax=Candidatus Steffania adelgidicola TaxID=1076626 RepID=UPI001D025BC5|nr:NAD(+) kinase [Candidatus Steffania adelgidicola]UDG79654.1 NAD kinase [Candidatus Steffania adelgidicola]
MSITFHTIGIVGYPHHCNALASHQTLYHWLKEKGYLVIMEHQIARKLAINEVITGSLLDIGEQADLAIVIGGDGNMLGAARVLARHNIKIIGINRGNLGFLTDLDPDSALAKLSAVLSGKFRSEKRFLLEAVVFRGAVGGKIRSAINEVVLHSGKVAHMIEFEVYIDDDFAFSQRSDGLIIATPTGSTAYSLSAGGPILTPVLDAIVLVPMFPHTLSSRPLVINGGSTIRLKFSQPPINLEITFDSQIALSIQEGEEIFIRRSSDYIDLVHPDDYNYFNILSSKLGWSKKLF